jgi:hypothetical protein
VPGANGKPDF